MHTYSRKMKTPCNKNLDVFDFKPETEVAEFGIRTKGKLENPRNAIDKYAFLENAASGKNIAAEEINYVPSLTVDSINMNHVAITLVENPSAGMMTDPDDAFTAVKQHPQSNSELKTDLSESEVNVAVTSASPSNNKVKSSILDLLPSLHEIECSDDLRSMSEFHLKCSQKLNRVQDETVRMGTNENGSMCERFSSPSVVAEDDGPSSDHCIDEWEMENEDVTKVILYPDHVLYRGTYYTDPLICFTSNFIEMEGSEGGGDDKTFKCKWGVEDILHIMSHWHERVEMAMVQIHVLAKDTIHTENVECTSGAELKFPVVDSSWYERLEAIASLNITYKALWTSMLDSEDTLVSSSRYLPIFDRPFEEVVYPKGDADAVSISKRDFDLLQPETFVNDTIIDFYIKYLKNKIKPDEKRRLHFFNSFFFRKLADPDKDPLDASKGAVAYQRVKKWTRKVNLFEKDYVFIPVNYNYHWSLIVVCHLGEVATYEEDVNESMKVPCILHMDSIRGSHTGLQGLVQSYLKEEWKARHPVASEVIASRFDDLRFISLELPQQQNSYDCGLFLLHYVELFLEQAPLHFNPFKISQSFSFLNVDWFPPAEASLKRVVIQKLICDLLENPHQEPYPTASNDQQCHVTSLTINAHKDTVVNVSLVDFNPSIHPQSSHDHQAIEIQSSTIQSADDANIALKPSFDSEFNCAAIFDDVVVSLNPVEQEDVQQNNGIMPDDSALPCSTQDCRTQEPWQEPVMFDHATANNNHQTPSEVLFYGCDDSIEIVNENSQPDSEKGQPKSPLSLLVDTLQGYDDQMADGDVEGDPVSMGVIIPGSSFNFHDIEVVGSENSLGLGSDVQHRTKRMRVAQPQKVSLI